jgi:hypothetical protein
MRLLLGIILGGVLTVGGAYLYDSHNALAVANAPASVQQPLVNWDVVDTKWQRLTERPRRMDPPRRLNAAAATESTLRSHAGA